jgi:hypothetical protein
MMDFSQALERLKLGAKLHRSSWREEGDSRWIQISKDSSSFEAESEISTVELYCLSSDDILSDDWGLQYES